jgi:hypothetical protein
MSMTSLRARVRRGQPIILTVCFWNIDSIRWRHPGDGAAALVPAGGVLKNRHFLAGRPNPCFHAG